MDSQTSMELDRSGGLRRKRDGYRWMTFRQPSKSWGIEETLDRYFLIISSHCLIWARYSRAEFSWHQYGIRGKYCALKRIVVYFKLASFKRSYFVLWRPCMKLPSFFLEVTIIFRRSHFCTSLFIVGNTERGLWRLIIASCPGSLLKWEKMAECLLQCSIDSKVFHCFYHARNEICKTWYV